MSMSSPTRRFRARPSFTLIELLVVISIIAVLAAILLPALSQAMQRARMASCTANQRQIYLAYSFYFDDFNDHMPPANGGYADALNLSSAADGNRPVNLGVFYASRYLEDARLAYCSDHSWNAIPGRYPDSLASLASLVDTGRGSAAAFGTYIMRGPTSNQSWLVGDHYWGGSENRFVPYDWVNHVSFDPYIVGAASRVDGNLEGGRFLLNSGAELARLNSPRAILMCAPPTSFKVEDITVHSNRGLNALYIDGVSAAVRPAPGTLWFQKTNRWAQKFVAADAYHPSYAAPTKQGSAWTAYPNLYGWMY